LGLIIDQLKHTQQEFSIIAGSAGFLLDSLKVGCTGGICAIANVLGNEVIKVYDNFMSGNLPEAELVQKKLVEPNKHVTRMFGVAALKASLDANGYYGGPCRIPLLPLNNSEYEQVKNSFLKNEYSWSLK
jgi:4-hydroxy-2-oxoglutarate aldolase